MDLADVMTRRGTSRVVGRRRDRVGDEILRAT